ncbi:MAG: S8/S53 family peptidase [Bacteroidota bacterium]
MLSTWLPFEGICQTKHWIYFTDKPTAEISLAISPETILKRIEEGRILDEKDYGVSPSYLNALSKQGVQISQTSRWLNAASAVLSPSQLAEVKQLPFVENILPVNRFSKPASITEGCDTISDLDSYTRQLSMIGLDKLHESGFTGKGVTIAVFDNGFRQVDQLEGFSHIFQEGRMIATRDFVDGDDDVYEDCFSSGACRHGTHVLSTIAGVVENELMGAAPDANFILLRTEDDASETSQEEDNWVAAAEYADSLGTDIFSTSLGYLTYDGNIGSYSSGDLDGNTAAITLAGDIASEKGIIVVNSAGNRGANGLMAPSDGRKIISVGAVDKCRDYATFSSVGPTADGRLKPDISTMGQRVFTLSTDGSIGLRSGTSFSCPILSGFAACLLEASPQATRDQLYQAIIESGDEEPNYFTGHGVPNGPKALQWLRNFIEVSDGMVVFPNPSTRLVNVSFNNPEAESNYSINILNINGQTVFTQNGLLNQGVNSISITHNLPEGIYFLQIIPTNTKNQLYTRTFVVTNT